jgi:hypothetical protein
MSDPRPETHAELIERIRSIDAAAPESLHRGVEQLVQERMRRRRSPSARGHTARSGAHWPQRAAALGGLAAVLAAVLAVALSSGGSTLTLHNASALALSSATLPAPRENPHSRSQLELAVDGVTFPYWEGDLGWRATGTRTDHVAGRTVRTVFYTDWHGRRVGYAIVAGGSPPHVSGGTVVWRGGTPYRLLHESGGEVVTWTRGGRLCVIAAHGVSGHTLLRLASWATSA